MTKAPWEPWKIYIAGPQVFLRNPMQFFEKATELCRRYEMKPLIPYDSELTDAGDIRQMNIRLLREADGLVADVTPFRGSEPDSGTCWEIGYTSALDKPISLYTDDTRSEGEKQVAYFKQTGVKVRDTDRLLPDGMMKNPHGRTVNLMLMGPGRDLITIVSTLEQALLDVKMMLDQESCRPTKGSA